MSRWIPYLELAFFPLSVFVPFNLLRFSWGYHHRLNPMPPDVQEKAERIDRYVWPLRNALIVIVIVTLMRRQHVSATRIGLHLDRWQSNVALGIGAAFLLVGLRGLVWKYPSPQAEDFKNHEFLRGPALLWCLVYLIGAFAEELWVAFSVVSLRDTGHSVTASVLMIATAFGLAHFPYRWGTLAIGTLGALSCVLFIWTGSLVPSYLSHFLGNIGALYWGRRAYRKPQA